MSREITYAEVCEHKTEKSLWIVINNKVYDVTKFLSEHPGGDEVLLEEAGKDATEPFEDVGHSEDARAQVERLFIGNLSDPENLPKRAGKMSDMSSGGSGSSTYVLIVAVVAAIVGYLYLNKNK